MRSPVDVIVPVYRDLEITRACLDSVLAANNSCASELIVINDASPEPAVHAYLKGLSSRGLITLLENASNLGFVRSVNLGMRLHADRDVILLNSDTLVCDGWIDRLTAAGSAPRVATVTPFSNNATLCSYPKVGGQEGLPYGILSVPELDGLFARVNAGESVDIPVGVGFCLWISRAALRECGFFDEERFGLGYGEEVEFCLRARRRGWTHRLACDVYVQHVGAVSFGSSGQSKRDAAAQVIRSMHPEFEGLLQSHLTLDPARFSRARVSLARLENDSRPKVLSVTHSRGGGVALHLEQLSALWGDRVAQFELSPRGSLSAPMFYALRWVNIGESLELFFGSTPGGLDKLRRLVEALGVSRVHVHHLLGARLSDLHFLWELDCPKWLTAHDFLPICPQVNLWSWQDKFCGVPESVSTCETCIERRTPDVAVSDVAAWRAEWKSWIDRMERVIFPTSSVRAYYEKALGPVASGMVAPHPEPGFDGAKEPASLVPRKPLRVLLLGQLDLKKGSALLQALIPRLARGEFQFSLYGSTDRPVKGLNVLGTEQDFFALKDARQDFDLAFFSSLVPETYSYALSRVLERGLPIVAFDLGAFHDRLLGRPSTWLIPHDASLAELETFFGELTKKPEHPRHSAASQNLGLSYESLEFFRLTPRPAASLLLFAAEARAPRVSPSSFRQKAFDGIQKSWLRARTSPVFSRIASRVPRTWVAKLKRRLRSP